MDRWVRSAEDVLRLMDGLFAPDADRWTADGGGADWWDGFWADRDKPVPFFVDKPDESLVRHVESGMLRPGRALDLGCGAGRNARYLAARGFDVDAVDLSATAVAWAREQAPDAEAGGRVRYHCGDAFALSGPDDGTLRGPYDLVYDSGCFHHLPPHRRVSHLALLDHVLAPGGYFGLSCFAAGAQDTGSELDDAELYRTGHLHGGLAYTDEALRHVFAGLAEVDLRRMHDEPADGPHFGEPFLWAALFRRCPQEAG